MRQDPDVMLVGETRDPETAKTSMEAALTGHSGVHYPPRQYGIRRRDASL